MKWRIFTLPHGFTRGTNFPGNIMESINVESVINCALLSTNEYFSLFKGKENTLDKTHFNEHSLDECMTDITEDLIDVVSSTYDIYSDTTELRKTLCDEIAPCYDKLKEVFHASSVFQGVFEGTSAVESFNTYIFWIDATTFALVEFNERLSLDGILNDFPWIKDYSLLGI